METLLADVRHSLPVLIKSPGFTIVWVLALALGIGANTAIFSVIDRVLLAPLPFPDSERIMRVQRKFPNGNGSSVSIPKFMAWRKSRTFQSMAAYDFGSVSLNLGMSDRPNPVNGMHVTANFFSVFGLTPVLGQTFSPEEDLPKAGKFSSGENVCPRTGVRPKTLKKFAVTCIPLTGFGRSLMPRFRLTLPKS